jgi:acyl-activating enzyme 14
MQQHGARVTTTCEGRTVTGQQLHDRVALLSWGLSNVYNIEPGDRVGLLGLNSDTFFVALLAVLDAGAVACPMNWRWSGFEVAAAIDLTQPSMLLADEVNMQLARSAQARASHATPVLLLDTAASEPAVASPAAFAGQTARKCSITDNHTGISSQPGSLLGLLQAAAAAHQAAAASLQQQQPHSIPANPQQQQQHTQHQQHRIPQLQLKQPSSGEAAGGALICFTSGTTGASKGALLSHASIMHQSMAKLAVVRYSSNDVYLHVAPLFHIGGLSSAFAVLLAGGSHVFMPR